MNTRTPSTVSCALLFSRSTRAVLTAAALLLLPPASRADTQETGFSRETTQTSQTGDRTQTITTQTSGQTAVNNGTSTQTPNGMNYTAGATGQRDASTGIDYANAKDAELGGSEIKNGQTVLGGGASFNTGFSRGNEHANLTGTANGTANGQIQVGENGVEMSGAVGIELQLKALAQASAGNDMLGANAQAEANIQAVLKAQGRIGAYFDDKGLTIGAEAKAEAMVSASASLNMGLTVFGIAANVKVTANVQAGASASAAALVTIGYDGKIRFKLGAGAAVGVGGGMAFEFEVSAADLMQKLGFSDLESLIEWVKGVAEDPSALIDQLTAGSSGSTEGMLIAAANAQIEKEISELVHSADKLGDKVLTTLGSLPGGGVPSGLSGLFGGGGGGGGGGSGSSGGPGNSGVGGGGGTGGSNGGSGGSGTSYKRDEKFKQWSK